MRKLKLSVDELHVESFGTAADGGAEAGTVRGNQALSYLSCVDCASQNPCSGYPVQCGSGDTGGGGASEGCLTSITCDGPGCYGNATVDA